MDEKKTRFWLRLTGFFVAYFSICYAAYLGTATSLLLAAGGLMGVQVIAPGGVAAIGPISVALCGILLMVFAPTLSKIITR